MLSIRKGTIEDLDEIMDVYAAAREFMRKSGNPNQWGTTHPAREIIVNDIKEGKSYVVVDDGLIVANFFFDIMEDPTYKVIEDGKWLNNDSYGVIHRIGSNGRAKGVLPVALELAFSKTDNVRIDTHEDNKVMQHLLSKNGFTRCGIIHLLNGDPRIAYHKCISKAVNE